MRKKFLPCLLLSILIVLVSGCSNNETNISATTASTEVTTQTDTKVTETVTESTAVNTTSVIESTAKPTQETTVFVEPTTEYVHEPTQPVYEEENVLMYEKYVGLWEYRVGDEGLGGCVKLGVFSINENIAEVTILKVSPNYAHLAGTEMLTVPVKGNRLELSFTDSFSNKCNGYAELNEDSVYLKINIEEAYQPFIYGANVDVTLYKKSNEVSRDEFI